MSWRDLKPLDDWYELERPSVKEKRGSDLVPHSDIPGEVVLTFTDDLSREWFAEWLRSKRGWQAFQAWVDEKR